MRSPHSLAQFTAAAMLLHAGTAFADLPQREGWPVELPVGVSGGYVLAPMEGVALVDVDGESGQEVIASSGDRVWVLRADGTALGGWPATVQGTAQRPPSVGDVDGDGQVDIVQVARGLLYSDTSHVHAIAVDGTELPGWPRDYPNLIANAATLADLDGDGALEIFVQTGQWPPAGTFIVLGGDGQPLGAHWEHPLDSYPLAPPAVGDLDGDEGFEVAYATLGNVTVRRADGSLANGFPREAAAGTVHEGSVAMADLDPAIAGLELVWCETEDTELSGSASLYAARSDGQLLDRFPVELAADVFRVSALSIGDVTGDGALEVVVPLDGHGAVIVTATGQIHSTVQPMAQLSASVQLVDLDGDGDLELIIDNNTAEGDGRGYVEAYHDDGAVVTDFPLRPMGTTLANGGSLGDLDGDGVLELVVVSVGLGESSSAWVNVWSLPQAQPAQNDWPTYASGPRRPNCRHCPASLGGAGGGAGAGSDGGSDAGPVGGSDGASPAGAATSGDDGGCGCRASPQPVTPLALWLLVVATLCRRYRRPAA